MQRSSSVFKSFEYAIEGVKLALKYNRNLRIHFVIAFLVILLSIFLNINAFEAGIVAIAILFVICTEMINSVIEEMVNLIIKEHREEARIAKDVGAGMVLLAAIGAFIIGLMIFTPYIIELF